MFVFTLYNTSEWLRHHQPVWNVNYQDLHLVETGGSSPSSSHLPVPHNSSPHSHPHTLTPSHPHTLTVPQFLSEERKWWEGCTTLPTISFDINYNFSPLIYNFHDYDRLKPSFQMEFKVWSSSFKPSLFPIFLSSAPYSWGEEVSFYYVEIDRIIFISMTLW